MPARPAPMYDNPYDAPFWAACRSGELQMQRCTVCLSFQYPAGPICSNCRSTAVEWHPLSGRGKVFSWVRFHRQYYPEFPPPYLCLSVALEEGPLLITNPTADHDGADPVIGQAIVLEVEHFDDISVPVARLLSGLGAAGS